MIRLFAAVPMPEDVGERLALMRGGVDGARWVECGDFHLTLMFVGAVDSGMARRLDRALSIIDFTSFKLRLGEAGWFGKKRPHTLWAGSLPSPELVRLRNRVVHAAHGVGFAGSVSRFHPHVTLARLGRGASIEDCKRFCSRCNLFRSRLIDVSFFDLYSTRTLQGGAPYRLEARYDLNGASSGG